MPFAFIFKLMICSQLIFTNWLQNHLLPCPFKYLTGIDCPGCGFQRSAIALVQGNFHKSFSLYPPTLPIIIFFSYGFFDWLFKLDNSGFIVKKTLFMITGSIVMVSYCFKMWYLAGH